MTAVNQAMTIDKTGTSSASRSRRKSTEKSGLASNSNLENASTRTLILSAAPTGSSGMQEIEAKYTKVTSIF